MTVNSGDILRATVEMHYEAIGAIQNVYHVQNLDEAITDIEAIGDVIEMLETLMGIIAAIVGVLQIVDAVRITNVTQVADVGEGQFVDNTPFTGSGIVLPTQVCAGLNLTTERLNVGGRKYFGAVVTGVCLDGGLISTDSLVDLALAGDFLTDRFDGTTNNWRFGVLASFDAVWLRFLSYSIPTAAIIQRRRRLGVGI